MRELITNLMDKNKMIEKLKDLEQEAMDNLDPEVYDAIVSNVMEQYDKKYTSRLYRWTTNGYKRSG